MMILDARVNGGWIRAQCEDNEDAAEFIRKLSAGGSYVDFWVGRAENATADVSEIPHYPATAEPPQPRHSREVRR